MATCQIEKNMATIRMAIFCYLNNTREFLDRNQSISKVFWGNRICNGVMYGAKSALNEVTKVIGTRNVLFAVVRHPIDRFLSGYLDKCHRDLTYYTAEERCFGCGGDMRCFIEKMHRILIEFSHKTIRRTRMLRYYVLHFAPQTWYCEFSHHKKDYILINHSGGPNGTREIADGFDRVFRYARISKRHRDYIHKEMMKGTTAHSTSKSALRGTVEKQLLSDAYLMRLIMQMYYYDFVEFGFEY